MSAWGYGTHLGGWWGGYAPGGPQRVDVPAKADAPAKPKPAAERQAWGGSAGPGGGYLLVPPGYAKAPPGGYWTWWLMSGHPTLAFLQAVVTDSLLAGTRTVKVRDANGRKRMPGRDTQADVTGDGVVTSPEDEWAERCEACLKRHYTTLIGFGCRKLQYGHAPAELVWGRSAEDGLTEIARVKPWRPWEVGVLSDPYGDYAGVRYFGGGETGKAADRDPRYAVNFVAAEDGLYPHTGRPRLENCREEWWEKILAKGTALKLNQMASGIVPVVKGPPGEDGLQKSKDIAAALARFEPVYVPRYLFDRETLETAAQLGRDADTYEAYEIDTVDLGDKSPHAAALLEQCRYLDSELAYGYLLPPRAAMEGQMGTKAEAGVHQDLAVQGMERLHAELCDEITAGPLRTMTLTNRGPAEADRYAVEPAPLADPQQQFLQEIVTALVTAPATGPALVRPLDLLPLLRRVELPVRPDAADPQDEIDAAKEEQDRAKADALAAAGTNGGKPVNGNGRPFGGKGRMAGVAE